MSKVVVLLLVCLQYGVRYWWSRCSVEAQEREILLIHFALVTMMERGSFVIRFLKLLYFCSSFCFSLRLSCFV